MFALFPEVSGNAAKIGAEFVKQICLGLIDG
jgi:hypothetical protein